MGVDRHHITMALSDSFIVSYHFLYTMCKLLDLDWIEIKNKVLDEA